MRSPNKKILIVDDDKKIREALRVRLSTAGYDVVTASNGLEGLKVIYSEEPDLILLDIWMPIGIGFSLAQYLQKTEKKNVPVIFLSGTTAEDVKQTARQTAAAFLEKPYDPQVLLTTISSILNSDASHLN